MSIASNEVQAELLKRGDTDYYGKTEEWIKDKDIYIEYLVKNIRKKCVVNYDNVRFMRLAIQF